MKKTLIKFNVIIPLTLLLCLPYIWQQQEKKKATAETQFQKEKIVEVILIDEEGKEQKVEFVQNPDGTETVKGEFIKEDPEENKIIFDVTPCKSGGQVSRDGELEKVEKLDDIECEDGSSHEWNAITFKPKNDKKLTNVTQKTLSIKF